MDFAISASDNCGFTLSSTAASGDFFNVGTTTVSATATDGWGNSAGCSFDITVNDTILTPDKKEETMKADTVVLAMLVPNKGIKYGKYQTRDVYMIGDCVQVRRGYAAVHDGYTMGMQIDLLPYQTYHREEH